MFPAAPELGALRLAKLTDLPRIGVVAASAFYHSSWFQYERPYYRKYPQDTLASYRDSFRKAIKNPDSIVIVAEHQLNRSEKDQVYDELAAAYPAFEDQIPGDALAKDRVIVAVASFSLLPDSKRKGQFQPEAPDHDKDEEEPKNRDKDEEGVKLLDGTIHPRELQHFKNRMVIDMMTTHPAYWRQGHATDINKWFAALADMDGEETGVAGAPMGKIFFAKHGFKEVENVEVPGYKAHEKPVYAWLGVREYRTHEL
ncbi:hypothetical protein J4E81_008442 [Alternaria sp. BMP 2799]|nr:hypothetical protein J4E81_008442 [Alternaria sp. BMP 2799]